jgi:hypothetical protein
MHLSEVELIEAIDGTLAPERVAHLKSCHRCRREVEGLTSVLHDARGVDTPEPSPLFWDHFRARVRDAIDAGASEPAPVGWWRFVRGAAITTVALAIAATVVFFAVPRHPAPSTGTTHADVALTPPADPHEGVALDSDPEWTLLARVADDIDWDDATAEGLGVWPGAAERAAEQLSRDEQQELARLLREEIGGTGSL